MKSSESWLILRDGGDVPSSYRITYLWPASRRQGGLFRDLSRMGPEIFAQRLQFVPTEVVEHRFGSTCLTADHWTFVGHYEIGASDVT